jgi:hypothetical protein
MKKDNLMKADKAHFILGTISMSKKTWLVWFMGSVCKYLRVVVEC